MRNNWKTAFWLLLAVFISATLYFTYVVLDQATTIIYMKTGYEDTEHDLLQLSGAAKGKISSSDFSEIMKRSHDRVGVHYLELNRIAIRFGKDNKIDSIIYKW